MTDVELDESTSDRINEGRSDLVAWERSKPRNYFVADSNLQRVLQQHLGEGYAAFAPLLERIGGLAATRMDELARHCNRDENLPVLRRWNGVGERVEEVVFTAAHHELGAHFWGSGALALLREPGHETESGGLIYLLDHNGEAGHACPMACTAGLIKLLQQVGSEQQRAFLLPSLLEPDYAARLYAAQFVTEVQGGSDVGANDCRAEPGELPGSFRLSGEKWFCSVADATLFVVTARLPEARPGTAGLGLFLVPRLLHGRPNGIHLRRLKYKLGTRSLASAEIDLAGAVAEQIGPLAHGFKNLVGIVLDTSRVHNALAATGMMRRAFVEAQGFARHRRAFGRPILDFPAVQQTLARMKVQTAAAVATTFRLLALSDRLAAAGSAAQEDLRAARRTLVNINKYATAVSCTSVVRDGIELLGGNGTIEEFSVLPRLYRDAIVIESWEGTHNTLCAQVLRDFRERGLHRAWLDEQRAALDGVRGLTGHRARAVALLEETGRRIGRLLSGDAEFGERHVRSVVDLMGVLHAYVSLLLEADWERREVGEGEKESLLELYRLLHLDPPADPMDCPELAGLQRQLSAGL